MPKIDIKLKTLTPRVNSADMVNIRKDNIKLMISQIKYLTEEQIMDIEEGVHKVVCSKANRIGIPVDYSDNKQTSSAFNRLYNNNMRHLRLNMNPSSYLQNTNLSQRIQSGDLDISDLPNMSSYELNQDMWKNYNNIEEAELNIIISGRDGSFEQDTTLSICGKCKGNNCAYKESQTRSADEGSTHKIRCKDCGHKWNHYN